MENLNMTREDVMRFCREHQRTILFVDISVGDYSAARCCYLNGLLDQGAILGEQAIEKFLKGFLLLLNHDEKVGAKFKHHQLVPIIDRIEELEVVGFDKFRAVAQRLSDLYQCCRYPDSKIKLERLSMNSEEVHELDALYFFIAQKLPIPPEVKYRTGIYGYVGEEGKRSYLHPEAYWLTKSNKSFLALKEEIEQNYRTVLTHLYPTH